MTSCTQHEDARVFHQSLERVLGVTDNDAHSSKTQTNA